MYSPGKYQKGENEIHGTYLNADDAIRAILDKL